MNDRQRGLLRVLLEANGEAVNLSFLAEQLHCSEKTVRNDLNHLEEIVESYRSAQIQRKRGIGIIFNISKVERAAIYQRLLTKESKSTEDRLIEIAYQLLVKDKPITLEDLANRYYVPKPAIKKDLDAIAAWLKGYQLELLSKQRLGHIVQGDELKKRTALAHLPQLISTVSQDNNYVLDLFLPYEITTVRTALQEMQQHFSISFTDGAIESLLVHALIMLKRTRQKSPVYISPDEKATVIKRIEFQYASIFFDKLEAVLRFIFPEDERIYFTWHVISAKKREDGIKPSIISDQFLLDVINRLITKLEKLALTSFSTDSVLFEGLVVHMHSVINRIKYGFPITNPLLNDIKKMYPYMFNMIMLGLEDIKEDYQLDIPEDEAAYLVLHFQASIERLESKSENKKKTLIVCHMGVGMSHLLEAKIKQHYQNIDILACIGKTDVQGFLEKNEVEFVISTIDLPNLDVPTIVISPLLEEKDREQLNQFFHELNNKRIKQLEEVDIRTLIRGDLIFLDVRKQHRYEVVELLAQSLYEKGFVDKGFIHHAIRREKSAATAIGGGVAIPHASTDLVHQTAISVAILSEPMEWGNEIVSLVFMLAISKKDQKLNRGIVGTIASVSEDPTDVKKIIESSTIQQFLENIY